MCLNMISEPYLIYFPALDFNASSSISTSLPTLLLNNSFFYSLNKMMLTMCFSQVADHACQDLLLVESETRTIDSSLHLKICYMFDNICWDL